MPQATVASAVLALLPRPPQPNRIGTDPWWMSRGSHRTFAAHSDNRHLAQFTGVRMVV
jgi:hypothetical protein